QQSKFNLEHAWIELHNDDCGVKVAEATKAKGKVSVSKSGTTESNFLMFQKMWLIKEKDNDMLLLDCLLSRKDVLDENELALKNKLINDMPANK
ncbi:unnamed protein product, partial [Cochlearia groenlandica]